MNDLLHGAFDAQVHQCGQPVTLADADGENAVGFVAIVGDISVAQRNRDGGLDVEPSREVRFLLPFEQPIAEQPSFAKGRVVTIEDGNGEQQAWPIETVLRRTAWGLVKVLCVRSTMTESSGSTNRREDHYTGGGRLRRR